VPLDQRQSQAPHLASRERCTELLAAVRPLGSDPGLHGPRVLLISASSGPGGRLDYTGAMSVSTVVATAIRPTVANAETASFSMALPPSSIGCSARWKAPMNHEPSRCSRAPARML